MFDITVKNYKNVEMEWVKNVSSAEIARMRVKDALIDKVVVSNDIDVPQGLVDEEVKMMAIERIHKMKYDSLATGAYVSLTQDDQAECMKKFQEDAFKLVKTRLVLKGIIEAEKFTVSKGELEEEAKAMAARQQITVEMVKDFLGENLELLRNDLLIKKAVDFVYANAVITEGKGATASTE